MKPVRIHPIKLADLNFPLPHGVIESEAERMRLSPGPGDASLIRDLRRNAASDHLYIQELEADRNAQADVIREFQMNRALTLSHTFALSDSIGLLSIVVQSLVNLGHDVVMKFELVEDRRSLNVYVKQAA